MAPGRVVTCLARVSVGDGGNATARELRALAGAPLDDAAAMFESGSVDVIAYASTTSAYALGFDAEEALVARLSRRLGIRVVATGASAVLALRDLDVGRMALVHPPWTDTELNELGAACFRSRGFDVVSSEAAALAGDPGRVDSAAVYEWTSRNVCREAEAVFIGGNGFRAAGAIAALEAELDRPVLTANQVLLWQALAEVGAGWEVVGYGGLFAGRSGRP